MKKVLIITLMAIAVLSFKSNIVPPKYYLASFVTKNDRSYNIVVVRAKNLIEAKTITNKFIKSLKVTLDETVNNNPRTDELDFENVKTINNPK